jgi:hypothetical protein
MTKNDAHERLSNEDAKLLIRSIEEVEREEAAQKDESEQASSMQSESGR